MEIRILATGLWPEAGRRLRESLTELEMRRGPLGWFRGDLLSLENPADAALVMAAEFYDIVLLGLDPQSGAADFLAVHAAAPAIPMVLVAEPADEPLAARLIREGAQDYLLAPAWSSEQLGRTLRNAIERTRIRNGERFQCLYDPATGLPNRAGFLTFGEPVVRVAARLGGSLLLARGVSPAADPGAWKNLHGALDGVDLVAHIAEREVAILAIGTGPHQTADWAARLRAVGLEVHIERAVDAAPTILEDWLAGAAVRE